MKKTFNINRLMEPGQYRLTEIFADIRTVGILSAIFNDRDEMDKVLEKTDVFIVDNPHEMYVSNDDGSITIGLTHLRHAPEEILYLDIIHELCHVKQYMEGRDLYDCSKAYVDRETEIEAYKVTVQEARRIGLDDAAISNYLRVSWITPEEHKRLECRMDVTSFRDDDEAP
ncbi:MAG: hypothetical protein PHN75_16530 [Syntrophales bacterium]|nr:hypothetical protein [Syntrophales bacterium]